MQGYWNLPERTASAFLPGSSERYYRTGDVVVDPGDGVLAFVGRRDRMVKRRGYRIELGEIEAGLYSHSAIREVAVVAASDVERGTIITAFLSYHDGAAPSVIELKRFCAEVLPRYMVPDRFVATTHCHARPPTRSTTSNSHKRRYGLRPDRRSALASRRSHSLRAPGTERRRR
jgi:acyl-coenzyme A synthetase/AMP-(fatty) acid ligase